MSGAPGVVADAQVRREALDTGRSFIVQAPAGSGKTALLTARILCLLARVQAPEQILAITFTRKAAAEMRNRVLDALRGAQGPQPQDAYAAEQWHLARQALARDAEQGWALLDNPDRLQLTTIDAFCRRLASRLPLSSGLGAVGEPLERPEPLYREAARRTLLLVNDNTAWQGAVAALLARLDNDFARAEALLADTLAKRDQWLLALGSGESIEALLAGMQEVLDETLGDILASLAELASGQAGRELAELLGVAVRQLVESGKLPVPSAVAGWDFATGLPPAAPEQVAIWLWIADWLLTGSGTLRKQLNAAQGVPKGAWQQRAKAWLSARGEGPDDGQWATLLQRLRNVPREFSADDRQVLADLLAVMRLAVAQLQLLFAEQGMIDFQEVALRADAALGGLADPSDLALALDARLQHLLVDEFQDTSLAQFCMLEQLTTGWQAGDGRTLFLVGDPMQSIYSFRKADVGLFMRVQRQGLGEVAVIPLRLTVNFRSTEPVLAWINRVGEAIFPAQEAVSEGRVRFHTALPGPAAGQSGEIACRLLVEGDAGSEAEALAAWLGERRERLGSCGLLVPSRAALAEVLPALKRVGIPYQAVELEPLAGHGLVRDLHQLARALSQPADRVAWLAVLRAPWVGLSLADLTHLLGQEVDQSVPQRLAALSMGEVLPLSAEGVLRARHAAGVLLPALAGNQTLHRRVHQAWWQLQGGRFGDLTTDEAQQMRTRDAGRYLALLAAHEQAGRVTDWADLEQALLTLFAGSDDAADGVQCMTIHRAKGLEFDTVVLCGLHRGAGRDDPPLLRWCEHATGQREAALLVAPIARAGQEPHPLYPFIAGIERARHEQELTRLAYVAITRARQNLYLFGCVRQAKDGDAAQQGLAGCNPPKKGSLLHRLWPALSGDAAVQTLLARGGDAPLAGAATVAGSPLRRVVIDGVGDMAVAPRPPEAAQPVVEFAWVGSRRRHVGTLVHRYLCRLAGTAAAGWPDLLGQARHCHAALADLGVLEAELDSAVQEVCAALEQTLADARGRWVLAGAGEGSGAPVGEAELAITVVHDGWPRRLVVDRTFVSDGVCWVVDYKTGHHAGGDTAGFLHQEWLRYREQLTAYAEAMAALQHSPPRMGLYFPLMRGWVSWGRDDPAPRIELAGKVVT